MASDGGEEVRGRGSLSGRVRVGQTLSRFVIFPNWYYGAREGPGRVMSLALRRVINVMQRVSGTVSEPSLLDPIITLLAHHNTFKSSTLEELLRNVNSSEGSSLC